MNYQWYSVEEILPDIDDTFHGKPTLVVAQWKSNALLVNYLITTPSVIRNTPEQFSRWKYFDEN